MSGCRGTQKFQRLNKGVNLVALHGCHYNVPVHLGGSREDRAWGGTQASVSHLWLHPCLGQVVKGTTHWWQWLLLNNLRPKFYPNDFYNLFQGPWDFWSNFGSIYWMKWETRFSRLNLIIRLIFPVGKKGQLGKKILFYVLHVYDFPFFLQWHLALDTT